MGQQTRVADAALAMVGADALDDDAFEVMELTLDVLLEEVLAFGVSGETLVPRIGSREAVIEAFAEAAGSDLPAQGRALAEAALDRLGECGFVRFEEDQVILQVPVPPAA